MKELSEIVNIEINNMINDGSIETIIKEKLHSTIEGVVSSCVREYSEFGKTIQKKLEESLNNAATRVSFPEYNKLVSDVVVHSVNQALTEKGANLVKGALDKVLAPAPEEMTFSELLDKVRDHWRDGCIEDGHEEIEVEWSDYHGIHMILKNPTDESQNVRITFYDHSNPGKFEIGYIHAADKGVITGRFGSAKTADCFSAYLYKLYCAETSFTDVDQAYGECIYIGWD